MRSTHWRSRRAFLRASVLALVSVIAVSAQGEGLPKASLPEEWASRRSAWSGRRR